MKANVIHENHTEYTENFPFIFHRDMVSHRQQDEQQVTIYKDGRHMYYANCPVNWHKNMEVLCFFKGEADLLCGNENYKAAAGSLYVINPNDLHSVMSQNLTEYYCLIVDRNFCLQNDFPIDTVRFRNDAPKDPRLYRLFMDVAEAFSQEDTKPFRNMKIRSAVLALLTALCESRAVFQTGEPAGDKNVNSIKSALSYIDQNLTRRLTLAEIAAVVGMSKYYFASEFHRAVGCTCVEYINTMRCHLAKSLLSTGTYTAGEVCYLCGFENLSYFSKTFCRYIGVMPSACKKKKGEEEGATPSASPASTRKTST